MPVGTSRTSRSWRVMSAFEGRADARQVGHVGQVPDSRPRLKPSSRLAGFIKNRVVCVRGQTVGVFDNYPSICDRATEDGSILFREAFRQSGGIFMKVFFAAFLSASFFLTSSAALAVSCTQQGETCKGWASGQGSQATSFAAKCAREVPACISRCKKGSKVFIGVYGGSGGGQQYPIDECR
jgi:hypothetical protein